MTADESVAVEAAARRYFEALTEEDADASRYATGPLAELNSLNRASPFGQSRSELTIGRLEVRAVNGDSAEADIEARERLVIESAHGRQEVRTRLTGPLRLRRVEGEWKVADYVMDGRSIIDAFCPLETEIDGGGDVVVHPRGLFRHRALVLFLEVENRSQRTLRLSWAAFSCNFAPFSQEELAPGQSAVVRTGWRKRLAPWRRKVVVFVHGRARDGRERFTYKVRLDLRRGSAGVQRLPRMPASLWVNRQLKSPLVAMPITLAGLGVTLGSGHYHAATLFAGLLGTALLSDAFLSKRRERYRLAAVFLGAALELLVLGAVLFLVLR
jgi:hypothetical protein